MVGTTAGLIEARGQRDAARDAREQADADRVYAQAEFKRAEQEAGRARAAEVEQGKARREVEAALARSDGLRLGSLAAVARPTDPALALLLGLEAVRRYPHHLTYGPVYDAAADLRERRTVRPGMFNVEGVRLSPDGRRALAYSTTQTEHSLAVLDVATGKRLAAWGGIARDGGRGLESGRVAGRGRGGRADQRGVHRRPEAGPGHVHRAGGLRVGPGHRPRPGPPPAARRPGRVRPVQPGRDEDRHRLVGRHGPDLGRGQRPGAARPPRAYQLAGRRLVQPETGGGS